MFHHLWLYPSTRSYRYTRVQRLVTEHMQVPVLVNICPVTEKGTCICSVTNRCTLVYGIFIYASPSVYISCQSTLMHEGVVLFMSTGTGTIDS